MKKTEEKQEDFHLNNTVRLGDSSKPLPEQTAFVNKK